MIRLKTCRNKVINSHSVVYRCIKLKSTNLIEFKETLSKKQPFLSILLGKWIFLAF